MGSQRLQLQAAEAEVAEFQPAVAELAAEAEQVAEPSSSPSEAEVEVCQVGPCGIAKSQSWLYQIHSKIDTGSLERFQVYQADYLLHALLLP